eukprot:363399-Chlamydomonas_euryale.AAC.5
MPTRIQSVPIARPWRAQLRRRRKAHRGIAKAAVKHIGPSARPARLAQNATARHVAHRRQQQRGARRADGRHAAAHTHRRCRPHSVRAKRQPTAAIAVVLPMARRQAAQLAVVLPMAQRQAAQLAVVLPMARRQAAQLAGRGCDRPGGTRGMRGPSAAPGCNAAQRLAAAIPALPCRRRWRWRQHALQRRVGLSDRPAQAAGRPIGAWVAQPGGGRRADVRPVLLWRRGGHGRRWANRRVVANAAPVHVVRSDRAAAACNNRRVRAAAAAAAGAHAAAAAAAPAAAAAHGDATAIGMRRRG